MFIEIKKPKSSDFLVLDDKKSFSYVHITMKKKTPWQKQLTKESILFGDCSFRGFDPMIIMVRNTAAGRHVPATCSSRHGTYIELTS